jgi:hypothetical protein
MRSRLVRYFKDNVVAFLALFLAMGGTSAYAVNTIRSTDIVDGEVKSADIANQSITSADVQDGAINTYDVDTILGVDILDNNLTGSDIKDDSIGAIDIGSQQVGSDEVANDSLLQSDIRAGAVTSDEVLDNSLTGADINESTLNVPHIPTTANFWFVQPTQSTNSAFVQVASKNLPAGDYVFLATINTTGCPGCFIDEHVLDAECQLRNPSGSVIGGTIDRRYIPPTDRVKRSLSFNGGAALPNGGTVSVWCRGQTMTESIDSGQILTLRVDGFN